MKLSLDSVSYAGYFTQGESLPIEEVVRRAARFGFDGVDVFPHRPVVFPMDVGRDRRKALVDLAGSLDIELNALEPITNFMRSRHVLTQSQDKELLFVRECCQLAHDLGIKVLRIFAGFLGYFMTQESAQGYGTPAMQSRSLDVSTSDDYLRQWDYVRAGIREAGKIAADFGVTLALQNHPPITNNTEETIEMVDEVGLDSVKMALDLPLLARQDEASIREVVAAVGRRMVHSRITAIRFKETLVGVCGFDEVPLGEGRENYPAFLKACAEAGYDGFFGYEQCSPIILPGHRHGTLREVDRRNQVGVAYVRKLLRELGLYTGKKRQAEEAPVPVE
jgi:sugar phosphate isomerase/epimerase